MIDWDQRNSREFLVVPISCVLGFPQAWPKDTDKSGVSPKAGPSAEGNPNPTGISLPAMGRK